MKIFFVKTLLPDLNVVRADVDLALLAPGGALVDNHPLLRPLELVGETNRHNLNIKHYNSVFFTQFRALIRGIAPPAVLCNKEPA